MIKQNISPEELGEKTKNFIGKDGFFAIVTSIIIGFINSFYFVITNGTHPDTIRSGQFHISRDWEFSLGRFGIHFVDKLRYGFVNRFLIICIALILLSLTSVLIIKLFKIKNKIIIFLVTSFL